MNIQKMLKQAQEMQSKMTEIQQRLEAEQYEGASGGGMVRVVITGKGQAISCALDDSLVKVEDKEMLEDLIVAAFNDARTKMDSNASNEMSKLTAGLPLPPGMKLPF